MNEVGLKSEERRATKNGVDTMMEDTGEDILLRAKPSPFTTFFKRIGQTYQLWLDRWAPHATSRWIFTVVLIAGFLLRIVFKQVKCSAKAKVPENPLVLPDVPEVVGRLHALRRRTLGRLWPHDPGLCRKDFLAQGLILSGENIQTTQYPFLLKRKAYRVI